MTVSRLGFEQFISLAEQLGCVGVECRNDLPGPLFDGMRPSLAGDRIKQAGLKLLSLAEVKRFDRLTEADLNDVLLLLDIAAAAGAEGVALIPANDGELPSVDSTGVASAIELIAPHLAERGLVGLFEPLGFSTCAVRFKLPVVELLEKLELTSQFKLVHDTFHHHVAKDPDLVAGHTGLVHLSGVTDKAAGVDDMRDPHRGLVDRDDRLDNVGQIQQLIAGGYEGAFSFEAFSPAVHVDENPFDNLAESIRWIDAALLEEAA
jgi:2-keto-myo-inositol isomerase